jgi:hypothetical protein
VVRAIAIDSEVWHAFGESEEAIQSALLRLVRSMKKGKKTKREKAGVLEAAWTALFAPAKRGKRPRKRPAKKPRAK